MYLSNALNYPEGKSNSTDLEHVVTAIFYRRIKHGLFPSLYIAEDHWIVLECVLYDGVFVFSEFSNHVEVDDYLEDDSRDVYLGGSSGDIHWRANISIPILRYINNYKHSLT